MHNKCFFQNLSKTKCKEKCESPQKSVHPAENMSAKTSLPSQGLNPRSMSSWTRATDGSSCRSRSPGTALCPFIKRGTPQRRRAASNGPGVHIAGFYTPTLGIGGGQGLTAGVSMSFYPTASIENLGGFGAAAGYFLTDNPVGLGP